MMNYLVETTYEAIAYAPKTLEALLEQHKVVVLRDYKLKADSLTFFNAFSDDIGFVYAIDEDIVTGKPTGKRWIDITYDPDRQDRYRTAAYAQPLHTDFSYINIRDNVQFFYCVGQAELGGSTVFIDSLRLVELLDLANAHDLKEQLMTLDVVFSKGGRERVSKILIKDGEDYRLNWNYYCVDANNTQEVLDLQEAFHEFLERRVVRSGLLTEVLLHKNDVVFFHDELVLHGRNSYFATHKGQRSLNKGTLILESRREKNKGLINF
ncbi:TauD/TfdA family dioxygenase [Flavobacteriaceae bacterium LMO-SS05]